VFAEFIASCMLVYSCPLPTCNVSDDALWNSNITMKKKNKTSKYIDTLLLIFTIYLLILFEDINIYNYRVKITDDTIDMIHDMLQCFWVKK